MVLSKRLLFKSLKLNLIVDIYNTELVGGEEKVYVFNEYSKVKLIYINSKELSKQEVIYEGDITGFRNNLSVKEFKGFDKGQHFILIDENVKILKKTKFINSESIISKAIYYAGPEYLNTENIVF